MESNHNQSAAIAARGNVIVVAGAGTGKTSTLVARCLEIVRRGTSLDRILMVTFTEAAAAEMRHRLRVGLQQWVEKATDPAEGEWLSEQLVLIETAKISTIHSFCLRLVQGHFHELGLDPDVKVLDDRQCHALAADTLEALMLECYVGKFAISDSVKALVSAYAPDRDAVIRGLVLRLHHFTQSLANASEWMGRQQALWTAESADAWVPWLREGFKEWRREWRPALETYSEFKNIGDCLSALNAVGDEPDRSAILQAAEAIHTADTADWNRQKGTMRKPFSRFFDEAEFLGSAASEGALDADWRAVRGHMTALLALTTAFTRRFTEAKRELGGVDFPDLEQLTLRLLIGEDHQPTAVARHWQARLDFVFVDECQDINGAQDAILSAVSRNDAEANRFLVGDVKQSIYQFRLADPQIFRDYEHAWSDGRTGLRIPLTENFRSQPGVIAFVNAFFKVAMREAMGGVAYDPLRIGIVADESKSKDAPCVELHLIRKGVDPDSNAPEGGDSDELDLSAVELETRLVVSRLKELKASGLVIQDKEMQCERPVDWSDMAVLLRSPGPRTEAYAKAFHEAGIPLAAERGGFLEAIEIRDLVSLLQLLDNPLQDIPLLAVLRSPLVGLTLDQLATLRSASEARPFWRALNEFVHQSSGEGTPALQARVTAFLRRFRRWRDRVRQVGPSLCLEQVLADTHYDVLLQANPRGAEQVANVRQFLELARQFDPYLRQGLFRFLRYLRSLEEMDDSLEPAPVPSRDAVRLTSIHKSKGLEFPVVVLAGLGSKFNLPELHGLVLLDPVIGLAPKAVTESGLGRYPTLPYWLAERRQRQLRFGEELRLLYVAATRARDRLLCTGILPRKEQTRWDSDPQRRITERDLVSARCPLDWLWAWLPTVTREDQWKDEYRGASDLMRWELWRAQDERLRSRTQHEQVSSTVCPGSPVDPAQIDAVAARLSRVYPHGAATLEPAKSSVSALRRQAAEFIDEDAVHPFRGPRSGSRRQGQPAPGSAAERGILYHRFLQHLDVETVDAADVLAGQVEAFIQQGVLSRQEAATLELPRIAAFWGSEVGRRIRQHPEAIRRELPFTARLEAAEVRSLLGQEPDAELTEEFIVVQGVVDLAVVLEREVWVLDYKTDDVKGEALQKRSEEYAPQLRLYATALQRIYARPVRPLWLHFLAANLTVEVEAAELPVER